MTFYIQNSRLLVQNGEVVNVSQAGFEDCCCGDTCNDCKSATSCGYCGGDSGCTPTHWTVTFSGVDASVDSSCINCADGSRKDSSVTIDGEYLLTQNPGTCFWLSTAQGAWSYVGYDGSSCTGTSTNHSGNFDIILEKKDATTFELEVTGTVDAFHDTQTVASNTCDAIPEMANDLTITCGSHDIVPGNFADGGIATFEICNQVSP